MNMQPNKVYTVEKEIKIHTKPLCTVIVPQTGAFVKQTDSYFVFRGFRVRKDCVVQIAEVNE